MKLDDLDFKFHNQSVLKIDVQGYELKVLEGSKNALKNCIGVETEVEFIELYKDQPKFGEISSFMEEHISFHVDALYR